MTQAPEVPEQFARELEKVETREAVDVAEQPFTPEEIEELRKGAREGVGAEEVLCTDWWSDDMKPAGHVENPGRLMWRGHAVSWGCIYVLGPPLLLRSQAEIKGWNWWSERHLKHKSTCKACSQGTREV